MSLDVAILVRGFTAVTDDRLEAIYRKYAPMLHRRCLTLLGDEEEARDALHDLFLQIRDKLHTFKEQSAMSTWLYRIATNHCLNRLRNTNNRARLLQTVDKPSEHDPRIRFERRNLLHYLLRQLDARDVQIAVHWHLDGMTQSEIASLLNISDRTVRNRLKALNGQLAETLKKLEDTRP